MILQLSQGSEAYKFALGEEGFSSGYENNMRYTLADGRRTHPGQLLWEGGKISDLSVSLEIVVGALDKELNNKITTSDELMLLINALYTWSLPVDRNNKTLLPVVLCVGNGTEWWFVRRGFIESIKTKFTRPWDVLNSGNPMRAMVDISFKMHPVDIVGTSGDDKLGVVNEQTEPARPWMFGVQI